MDSEKFLKKIKDNRKNSSNQYFKIIKRIIENDLEYYEGKEYIRKILMRNN